MATWTEVVEQVLTLDPAQVRAYFMEHASRDTDWPRKRAEEQPILHSGECGVYAFADRDNNLLYVGSSAVAMGSRVWQNHTEALRESEVLYTLRCDQVVGALMEAMLLRSVPRPRYNKMVLR